MRLTVLSDSEFLVAQYGDLLECMPDAIVVVNFAGHIVLATNLAETMFGCARGELRGSMVETLLPLRFRGSHIGHRSNYVSNPRNRAMGAGQDLVGLRKDGSEFPVEISLSPLKMMEDASLVMATIRDITERQRVAKTLQELSRQNQVLLREMQHRVANSLQIIASILSLKAQSVSSQETRLHLRDAQQRVLAVAAVQQHLHDARQGDLIQVAPYLSQLCGDLASSIIGDNRPITLSVEVDASETNSGHAVSLGLIVTELVINAIKYAFPGEGQAGQVVVHYDMNGLSWKLNVSDNGVGQSGSELYSVGKSGLGTDLIKALAEQLGAQVEIISGPKGMSVSVTHSKVLAVPERE